MLSIAYYFLQVSLCSAVMMLYYALVLRNKRFHQYNRFYLLGVAVLPWLMPLVKIEINKPTEAVSIPIQLFSVIADTNSEFEKTVADKGFQFTWETLVATLYIAVSGVLLTMLLIAMVKIYKLLKTNSCKNLDDVYLVLTQANGTPFSFFKFIFWHTDIDVTTTAGKQMLQHELTHVREKHSLDKLLLQIVLIIGWANPIFWLLKRELETIHEFIADNKAIDNGDTAALATMLLAAAYPQQRFALTNPFFYSPIKRRIAMLTTNKYPRFSYARRLIVLPLLVTVTLLFAFRKKETKPITLSVASALENVVGTIADVTKTADCLPENAASAKLAKTYTVVIDAGHGGTDAGAPGIDGKSFEKNIALSIAKLVKAQNANANINIVLTRDNDVFMSPMQKADFANKANADLFLSVHCNLNDLAKSSDKSPEGVEIYIANKEKARNYQLNHDFAAALSTSLVNQVKNDKTILTRYKGIWVLQATNCPSALVECGYMDNKADLKNLTNPSYQQTLATNILKGIETYLVSKEKGVSAVVVDTVPNMRAKIEGMIVEGKDASRIKGTFKIVDNKSSTAKSDEQVMVVTSGFAMKDDIEFKKGDSLIVKFINAEDVHNYPVIVYNSKRLTQKEFETLCLSIGKNIEIMVLKTPNHIGKFGEAGKNGIVVIRERGENPLYVIDGKPSVDLDMKSRDPNSIKSIQILKDKKATDKYGEKGKNGVIEVELKKSEQPFDYKKNGTMHFNGKDTFYTYVKIDAEFPGGREAWAKYLERNLRIPEEAKIQHAPVGKYTVIVTFTVNKDGTLSNISTLNNPGYGMSEAAVQLIAKGPKWLVAVDNSKRVASVIKREIVFTVDATSVFNQKNSLEQAVATQRVLPTELKKFQQVSADVSEVFWIGSVKNLVIKIQHKNGLIESYDLFDAKSKSMALAKYDESILLNCKFVLKAINEQKKLLKV